jgi:hypothetical protein
MSSPTLGELMDMLKKLRALDDTGSLKSLMDKYDISDNIKGKASSKTTSYPSVYSSQPPTFFGGPPMSFTYQNTTSYANFFTFESEPESVLAEKNIAFEKSIDSVGKSESVMIDNPTPTIERSPDYTQTITGWRGWTVKGDLLSGLGVNQRWQPKAIIPSLCTVRGCPRCPNVLCNCGYWSFKNSELMKKALLPYRDQVFVVGSVDIWGKIIECENGYRSEFAYPKELWLLKPGLEHLSWTYGVKIRK